MAQNEMRAMCGLPLRVRSMEGLGGTLLGKTMRQVNHRAKLLRMLKAGHLKAKAQLGDDDLVVCG